MRHEYFWLRDLMIEKGASKDELEELEECRKKIANFKLKYGFVSHPLKEVRSLKETGHTIAEIAEELELDRVDVRPMKEAANE